MASNICFSLTKLCVTLIILAAMVLWAILLAQVLNNWDDKKYYSKQFLAHDSKAFYITDTCIPELFAIIAVIAVGAGNQYWCQTCGIVIGIFWVNDHQRSPELFYYGSPLQIAAHALHIGVIAALLLFGSICGYHNNYYGQPSRVVNASAPPCSSPNGTPKYHRY